MREQGRLPAVAYVALALGVVFVAGEEISWGKRVLGFGAPEANMHNPLGRGRLVLEGLYLLPGLWWSARDGASPNDLVAHPLVGLRPREPVVLVIRARAGLLSVCRLRRPSRREG